tara:strand:- start:1326 stop:1877 length:552 start_codon:yes stop_codon:yes gene_type:complete
MYSNKKATFRCHECTGEFESVIANVARGSWCPSCTNKTEKKVFEWLKSLDVGVVKEWSPSWCRGKRPYRYDFMAASTPRKLIVELDGRQHFECVKRFRNDVAKQRSRDMFKMKQAIKNGFNVVRLYQPDVLGDTFDWKEMLLMSLAHSKNNDPIVVLQRSKSCVYNSAYVCNVRECGMECVLW